MAAGWQVWIRRPRAIEFTAIPGLPGWRQAAFDGVTLPGGSATSAVFAGLGEGEAPPVLAPADLCALLYPDGERAAIFTDVNCPNCRSLEAKLAARPDLHVTYLDLPLLGPASETAARALIAAETQGKGDALRAQLAVTQPLNRATAAAGLDTQQLAADMAAPEVEARLLLIRRAAETLGVYGTPGLTIGRTLIMGDMPGEALDRLIGEAGHGC